MSAPLQNAYQKPKKEKEREMKTTETRTMTSPASKIIQSIALAGKAYENNGLGSRETLIELGRALVGELEIPSEFIQRSFWAEVNPPITSTRC